MGSSGSFNDKRQHLVEQQIAAWEDEEREGHRRVAEAVAGGWCVLADVTRHFSCHTSGVRTSGPHVPLCECFEVYLVCSQLESRICLNRNVRCTGCCSTVSVKAIARSTAAYAR